MEIKSQYTGYIDQPRSQSRFPGLGAEWEKALGSAGHKISVKPSSQGWLIAARAYPGFCSMKRLEVFLLPLDGMLVHRRSLPRNFVRFPQQIAGTHLYTWVERGTVRVKCLGQEHNTLSPARARTRTARSGVEHTNHEATTPPTSQDLNTPKNLGCTKLSYVKRKFQDGGLFE